MFPFSRKDPTPETPETPAPAPKAAAAHPLDALTGGVFSAATSGERAQRVREWLATEPTVEHMQEVFKELSAKDKGAARALREKLDEIKRAKNQEAQVADWAARAEALLAGARLLIADVLAWQRDAARAGAPLSREPLAGLRARLNERMKVVEDLQNQAMVQREAAVLLAQRIELLSTRPWTEAVAAHEGLQADVAHWRSQKEALIGNPDWASVDARFAPSLEASRTQLAAVWEAFSAAQAQAQAAAEDASAPLPPVPMWADELRVARGLPAEAAAPASTRATVDPAAREQATQVVEKAMAALEAALTEGHTRSAAGVANALRQALAEHKRVIDEALAAKVNAVLAKATELEGWQRWRADQLREELVAKAEALLVRRKPKRAGGKKPAASVAPVAAAAAEPAEPAAPTTVTEPSQNAAEVAQAPTVTTTDVPAETPAQPEPAAPAAEASASADTAAPASAEASAAAGQAAPAETPESAEPPAGAEPTAETKPAVQPELTPALAAQEAQEAQEATAAPATAADAPAADAPAAKSADANASANAEANANAETDEGELVPAMGGHKLQETLRQLREQWKTTDQGGAPNHALWKRFDAACNAAYKFVEEWLTQKRAESAEHKAQRVALIDEVKAWGAAQAAQADAGRDWKAFSRQIHRFADRWRNAGHLSEKVYGELQPQWKAAIHEAARPLELEQQASVARRHALIDEAQALGAAPQLRIDAVKALQQRWQAEAQTVPLERKHEQKLWDAFRKPIDEAFNRKSAEREKVAAAMSAHDKAVLDAAKALEAAIASGDAQKIQAAMKALDDVQHGRMPAPAAEAPPPVPAQAAAADEAPPSEGETVSAAEPAAAAAETDTETAGTESGAAEVQATDEVASADTPTGEAPADSPSEPPAAPAEPPKPARKVVAMRGDDRPGARIPPTGAPRRDERPGGRGGRDGRDGGRPGGGRDGGRDGSPRGAGRGDRGDRRFGDRPPREDRGPRLGDTAFRAQRDAVEQAQAALRKLAAQAHGEALTQLLGAWQQRQAEQMPSAQELGRAVSGGVRSQWTSALGQSAKGNAGEALLRLEMAAEVPTPAEHLDARRAMQLQLLTRRHDPSPSETWSQDVATVLSSAHDEANARRLQNALKALLRR